eukprot:9717626-Alexandrium_andersonii.AAC.1
MPPACARTKGAARLASTSGAKSTNSPSGGVAPTGPERFVTEPRRALGNSGELRELQRAPQSLGELWRAPGSSR